MREQLEEIYSNHKRGLYALAVCLTGTRTLAEDAVHDAFVKLCSARKKPRGSLVSYVYAAVRNAAHDIRRRRNRMESQSTELFERIDVAMPSGELPERRLESLERQQLLQSAILSLQESSRETIVLKCHAGLTFDAIGEMTGERPATVATRYRRALEQLQQKLKGQL